jgi:hypothetical protein
MGVDFSRVILPTDDRKAIQAEYDFVNGQYLVAEQKVSRLLQLAEDGNGQMHELRARLTVLQIELDEFRTAREQLSIRLHVASSGSRALHETQADLKAALSKLDESSGRDEIREVLKRFIYRLSLWPFGLGQCKRPLRSERLSSLATLPCFEVQFQQSEMPQTIVVHPDDATKLFLSEYYNDRTNAAEVFEQNTEAILALMFSKPKKTRSKK